MLDELSPAERLLLLKYLCAFAWTDLVVQDSERKFVRRMAKHAALGAEELAQVEAWLDVAPSPGSIDLTSVPKDKRYIFIESARALMYSDGQVDPEERASLERLKTALAGD